MHTLLETKRGDGVDNESDKGDLKLVIDISKIDFLYHLNILRTSEWYKKVHSFFPFALVH